MNSLADNLLMQQVRDGKVEKLGILFERYHVRLYNFFLYLTGKEDVSKDLVQNVFFRMLKNRHIYRGQGKFTMWMYKIARNAHIDYLRKLKREERFNKKLEEPISKDPVSDEKLVQRQEIALLRTALAKLPQKKREVLVLSRYQNMKYGEIAELLGRRVGTVKTQIYRAIKDLRNIFTELSGGEVS